MNLQYSGEEKIPAGLDTVWAFVTDPEKVGRCFPEVVDVTVQDATHFEAVVKVGVGPVRGKFKMKVELLPAASKRRIDMKMSGGGFGSAVDLTAGADLVDAGDGTTLLEMERPGRSARPDRRRRRTRARRAGPEADRAGVWQRPPAVDGLNRAVVAQMSRVTLRERFFPLHQPDDVERFLSGFAWCVIFKAGTSDKTVDAWLVAQKALEPRVDVAVGFIRLPEDRPASDRVSDALRRRAPQSAAHPVP